MEEMEVLCSRCSHTKKFSVVRLKREDFDQYVQCELHMMPPSLRLMLWRTLILPIALFVLATISNNGFFNVGSYFDSLLHYANMFILIMLWWILGIYGDLQDAKERERDTLTQQTILKKYGLDKDSPVFLMTNFVTCRTTPISSERLLLLKESTIVIQPPK